MARLAGLEPATLEFEARYSIQLSYKRSAENFMRYNSLLQDFHPQPNGDIATFKTENFSQNPYTAVKKTDT